MKRCNSRAFSKKAAALCISSIYSPSKILPTQLLPSWPTTNFNLNASRRKNMLSQESQKMCFECSVAIKCEILKNFKIQTFTIYTFKLKFKLLNVLTHQNSTWDFWTLQTLFPPLKIDIFCRIVPLSFIEKLIKIELEIFGPLQTLFPPLKIDIFCCIVPPIFH